MERLKLREPEEGHKTLKGRGDGSGLAESDATVKEGNERFQKLIQFWLPCFGFLDFELAIEEVEAPRGDVVVIGGLARWGKLHFLFFIIHL